MKKQFAIALVALGIVQFAFGETITYTLPQDFSTAKIVDSAYDGYKEIIYDGMDVILEPAGAPRLLTSVVSIDVPKKAKLIKATYEAEWVTIGENIKIVPVQPLIISEEAPKEIPFAEPDPALYASYPASPISTFGVQRMAGKHFVPVRVIPFRYTNGKLEAAKKFVVTIEIEAPPPLMQSMSTAAHEVAPDEDYVKTDKDQPDYILIYPHNYEEIWKWYVSERQNDHREKIMLAKDFNEILAEFPVNTDDETKGYYARNDAERLHAYIRREAHKGTHYFVLAGSWYDAHGCPADGYVTNTRKELQVTTPQAQYKTNSSWGIPGIYTNPRNDPIPNEFIPGAKPCPSDLFYACCDLPDGAKYPWDYGSYDVADPEGDGWYANEPDDRIDLVADVVVTRIGFICGMTWRNDSYKLTMQDLVKGYLKKVRKAESPDFAGRNRFAGAGDTFSSEPGLTHGSTLREEMEFYTGSDNVFDKRHASYWMDTDFVVSLLQKDWFSRYLPAIHNEYISATTLPTGEPDWTTAVANLHKQDWEISTVFSHGSQGGSASQVYINEYAQKATGLSKIFFAPFPCLMSYPDWTPAGNRSGIHKITHNHSMIENPDGGATFTIGNTRSGWGGGIINRDCSVGDGLGVKMGGYFVKAYVRDRKTPGDAWLCMVQNYAQGGVGWSTGRWVLVIDQPLGDPLIETRFLEDYTWAGATTDEANWNLTDQSWTTNGVACVYDHADTASITATGNLTLNVATNVVGALRLEVNQPTDATFKLTGGAVRVATNMVVSAGNVTFGVGGGVGHEGLEFLNGKGDIRFEGDKKFYLAKIKNGGTVTFAGSNGLIDFRNSYYSFDTDYSKRAIGDITTKKVTANTLDIEALAFEGAGTGNIIRSDYPGVLTQYLPERIENQQFRLETYNGFDGALAAEKSLEIANGKMTIANNPNYGLAENKCFEAIDIPLTLDNSTLEIERIKTFWFGRNEDSEQTITVRGNSAITASSNGRIGLYGTTTIDLVDNATLSLSAPLDDRGNGKLVFTGSGTLTIENSTALAGEVEIGAGITVFLKAVPLPNVKNLEIGDNAKVILPKSSSGTYQLTPLIGAQLVVGNGVIFYNGSLDNPMEGAIANSNGSVFDPSGVLTWLGQKNNLWSDDNWVQGTSTAKFTQNVGVLFSDKAGEIPVQRTEVSVDGAYFGKFMQFANTKPYAFAGTTDNATLAFGTLTVGGDTQFRDLDLAISGRTDLMSGKLDADRVNAEDISVYNGATLSAGKVNFAFDKIRYIRVYFLAYLKNDTTSSVEINDSRVRMEELYLNYRDADGNLKTMRGGNKTLHGGSLIAGNLGMLFDGDAKHESAYRIGQNDSVEILAEDGAMEAGNVYIQIDIGANMPMLDSFGVHSSKKPYSNGSSTHAYRPTRFRIEASYDGVTYYKIMPNNDNDSFGNNDIGGDSPAFKGGWVGGSETAFKCNYQGGVHPTSVEVLDGGSLSAEGSYDANVTLADGAIVKAVPDKQLTASATSTWTFPEGGKVTLDTSALTLSDEPQIVLEDALNFTFATLYQFEPSEGASLRYLDGGKIAVVKSDDMKGPYTRTFGGAENWDTNTAGGWHYYGEDAEGARLYLPFEKSWGEQKLDIATDVVIDLSEDATITVDCNVEIDTIRACETNNLAGRSLTIVSDMVHTIKAQKLDFSGFDGDVVYGLDCGAAHVVAGQSLRLTGTGTGTLEVPSGATVTLTKPWQGTIIGNGTVILDPGKGNEWTDLSILKCNTTSTITLGSGSMNITEGTEITVNRVVCVDGAKFINSPTSKSWVLGEKNVEIQSGGELVFEINDNEWGANVDFTKVSGGGSIVYENKTGSALTTLGRKIPGTMTVVMRDGVYNLVSSSELEVAVNAARIVVSDGAVFSADSVGNTDGQYKYLRMKFLNPGKTLRIAELGVRRDNKFQILNKSKITCDVDGSANLAWIVDKPNTDFFAEMWNGQAATIPGAATITIQLDSPLPMFSNYSMGIGPLAGCPTSWDMEVSEDGVNYVLVSSVRNTAASGQWNWMGGGNSGAFRASKPADLTIASGGTLLAMGNLETIVKFNDGAILKPVAGQSMTLTNYADLMLPESGKVIVDLSGVEIERGTSIEIISGKTFTEADLQRFQLANAPKGYHLELGANGTLDLRSAKHFAPRVVIR